MSGLPIFAVMVTFRHSGNVRSRMKIIQCKDKSDAEDLVATECKEKFENSFDYEVTAIQVSDEWIHDRSRHLRKQQMKEECQVIPFPMKEIS